MTFGLALADQAAAQETDWTKPFVGGQFGLGWDDFSISNIPAGGDYGAFKPLEGYHGVAAGVQVGKNFYQHGAFVAGIVGDLDWNDRGNNRSSSQSSSVCQAYSEAACLMTTEVTGSNVGLNLNWDASVRGRAGFLALPNLLVYGTAGVAFGGVSVRASHSATNFLPWGPSTTAASASDNEIISGYVVGIGAEALVARNVGAFVQVLHYEFGDESLRLYGSPSNLDFDKTIVEMGISFYTN